MTARANAWLVFSPGRAKVLGSYGARSSICCAKLFRSFFRISYSFSEHLPAMSRIRCRDLKFAPSAGGRTLSERFSSAFPSSWGLSLHSRIASRYPFTSSTQNRHANIRCCTMNLQVESCLLRHCVPVRAKRDQCSSTHALSRRDHFEIVANQVRKIHEIPGGRIRPDGRLEYKRHMLHSSIEFKMINEKINSLLLNPTH